MPSARTLVRLVPFVLALAFTSALPACGKSPVASSPAQQTLTIGGASYVQTGHSEAYTATIVSSNGSRQTVTPTWTVSDSALASVTSGGELAGRDHGAVELRASYQNVQATKSVVVVHDYDGQWVGRYVVRSCDQSGIFIEAGWCQELRPGRELPIAMDIQSSASQRTSVAVMLALGTNIGNLSGVIDPQGDLTIGGPFTILVDDVPLTITIGDWVTPLSTDHLSMTGGWAQDVRVAGVDGNAYQRNELVSMVRTSSTAAVARVTPPQVRTWTELFARMRASMR